MFLWVPIRYYYHPLEVLLPEYGPHRKPKLRWGLDHIWLMYDCYYILWYEKSEMSHLMKHLDMKQDQIVSEEADKKPHHFHCQWPIPSHS